LNIDINATNPRALLRGTLATLAQMFGGYKDGQEFIQLFDQVIDPNSDMEQFDAGINALRTLINRVDGATAAYQLDEAAATTLVDDEPEDPHAAEDADIIFLDPTRDDLAAMTAPSPLPQVFRLPEGPAALFFHLHPAGTLPDFGLGNDVNVALNGLYFGADISGQDQPAKTIADILAPLNQMERAFINLVVPAGASPEFFEKVVAEVVAKRQKAA
jgi:hypothetical protein